ncbi:MAG: hypothetical protein IJ507_08910 [Clostridia bacterium]|nr:hypothetical protein [Clostridia bacterium]
MKCPNCGQWNRASLPRCLKCGYSLAQADASLPQWKTTLHEGKAKEYISVDEDGDLSQAPDARDQLAREMSDLKQRKREGIQHQRRLRRESAERGSAPSSMTVRTHTTTDTFWNVEDDPRSTVRIKRGGEDITPETGASRRIVNTDWQDTRSYDPLWEETEGHGTWQLPQTTQLTGKLPSRSRGLRRIVRALTSIVMVAVVGLCIFFGYEYFKARQAEKKEDNRPTVTASMKDDLAAHTILIPGEDGQQIYIRELHASYIVTGGFATVEIADHTWYDDLVDYVGETMTVTLTPFVKTASGRQQPMDLIQYDISIPLSPITLDSPDGMRTEVATAMYAIELTVRPGSTVTINGEDVSDTVSSEDGSFSYNATVQPIGDNVFDIRVRSQYCRENQMLLTLYREPQEIPLDLSADTYTSTNLKSIEIRATTLPGALVEVLTPHSDLNITNVDSTGEFSFMALFDHYGDNTITITSSYPGKKTSTVNYVVYYVPEPNIYTPKAWPLNAAGYSELLSNITVRAERTQIYVASGTIQYMVSDKPQMAVMNTSEDGKSQPVLLENFTKTKWVVGESYNIYADAYGTYSGMPWLAARYTYPR